MAKIKKKSAKQLRHKLARLCNEWDDLRDDPELAGGGSPGEYIIEKIWEIEAELKRRGLKI